MDLTTFSVIITPYYNQIQQVLNNIHFADLLTSFTLIASAEMGDKSQLVCMTLASRHRALPVLFGAIIAFALLNTLAVMFGAAIALWLPAFVVALCVALLFAVFGFHALKAEEENNNEEISPKSNRHIFFSTLLLIAVAEFGDKTQLTVVALGSTADPIEIWLGATAALSFTSMLGILAGRTLLQRLPLKVLHRISGGIFLILSVLACYKAYLSY